MITKETIIKQTIPILAREGYAGTTMRKIARTLAREPSILYAHFSDKESLLRATCLYIVDYLDAGARDIDCTSAGQYLRQTLIFQFKNREMIIALLQYFMAAKQDFVETGQGFIPVRAYAHLEKVIRRGVDDGIYCSLDCAADAKTSAHLINGYLMEYFDRDISDNQLDTLVCQLCRYIERALTANRVQAV